MEYTPEQFFALEEIVTHQGGVHLDEMCKAREYTFTGKKIKPAFLPGCGNVTIFEFPYEDEDGELTPTSLCAVCDNMGLMPRFDEAMKATS